ncbi:MAG: hypothetical protein O3C49_10200, partial [Proteobacteria bacterium]|nr:hypothetical protein [Pseudomonadota bacterium]
SAWGAKIAPRLPPGSVLLVMAKNLPLFAIYQMVLVKRAAAGRRHHGDRMKYFVNHLIYKDFVCIPGEIVKG